MALKCFWMSVCCRSRLADFFVNCQPEPRSLSGCLKENYADCLLAYSGLIGESTCTLGCYWPALSLHLLQVSVGAAGPPELRKPRRRRRSLWTVVNFIMYYLFSLFCFLSKLRLDRPKLVLNSHKFDGT